MTKVILFCLFNVLLNLIINFPLYKIEYNKYSEAILKYRPRINPNQKSNSLSSTVNSSKINNENNENKETEQKFESTPAEILIVCRKRGLTNDNTKDDNNNNINNENNNINKEKNNKNNLNNIEDGINIDLSLKKTKTKKSSFHPGFSQIQNDKKKNSGKNLKYDIDINKINKIKIMKNLNLRKKEKENIIEQSTDKNISKNETNNKIKDTFYDDNSINTKRTMVTKK